MNILIFTVDYKPFTGGISTEAYELARNFVLLNDKVVVLTISTHGCINFDKQQNFITIRVPTKIILLRELFLMIYFPVIIKKFRIKKVINMMWFPCGMICWLYYQFFGFDYYIRVVGGDIVEPVSYRYYISMYLKGKLRWLKKQVFKNAKKIFAISKFAENLLISQGVNGRKIQVVYYGADNFAVTRQPDKTIVENIRKTYNISHKKVLLTIARLDVHKGHRWVIEALPKVRNKIPNICYLIVGDGPNRSFLKELVKKKNLQDIVKFVGRRDDVENFYAVADIFIMLSEDLRWLGCVEGFGIVFLEAALKKVPVIAANTGGIPDAVLHNITGILVNPYDTKQVAESIALLLNDIKLREKIIENAYLRAKEMKWIDTTSQIRNALIVNNGLRY